jgi:hypothetical protein
MIVDRRQRHGNWDKFIFLRMTGDGRALLFADAQNGKLSVRFVSVSAP